MMIQQVPVDQKAETRYFSEGRLCSNQMMLVIQVITFLLSVSFIVADPTCIQQFAFTPTPRFGTRRDLLGLQYPPIDQNDRQPKSKGGAFFGNGKHLPLENGLSFGRTSRHMADKLETDLIGEERSGERKSRSKPKKNTKPNQRRKQTSSSPETWRLYGITTHPDADDWYAINKGLKQISHDNDDNSQNNKDSITAPLGGDRVAPIPRALRSAVCKRLNLPDDDNPLSSSFSINIIRRSLDARRKLEHPTFQYVVDVVLSPSQVRKARLQDRPGRTERVNQPRTISSPVEARLERQGPKKKVLVVGAGPAGLFCALQLAQSGLVEPILLDRGQPVERRGRDIGALIHRMQMNGESNFAFGEGGAGTWSDGKLTTRIGRNSANVRWILETLVEYGAPANILWEGAPHLGTDNLVRLLRNLRHDLEGRLGAKVYFGTKLTDIELHPENSSMVHGIHVVHSDPDGDMTNVPEFWTADAVVLATGHSARDVYETLASRSKPTDENGSGDSICCLEPKGFAVGFRIEHPQKLITKIQYGTEWGPTVRTGKRLTDLANQEYFASDKTLQGEEAPHTGQLPVPSYRLATDKARDGTSSDRLRGVYSFCMCPGGQIVPSSTNSSEICVNGMSFSKRDSLWANSALVVTVFPDDPILESYRQKFGVMAGVEFQRDMERKAAEMGGGMNLTVPVQRVTDFIKGQISETIPPSSYRLGVRSAPCHEIYPSAITEALRDALVNHFDSQMPGYVHPDGLLHGVETRTSSPLRIARDSSTYQARGMMNLFPAGEGAGFAGGIVSAAVDGRLVAEAVLDYFYGTDRPGRLQEEEAGGSKAAIGFNY